MSARLIVRSLSAAGGIIASGLMVACKDTPPAQTVDVGAAMHNIAPFDSLHGITFGTSARQLEQQRHALTRVAYAGYSERIGGALVRYLVSGSGERSQDSLGTLHGVEAVIPLADSADPQRTFADRLTEMNRVFGTAARCYRQMEPISTATALWDTPAGTAYLVVSGLPKVSAGRSVIAPSGSAGLRFGMSRDETARKQITAQSTTMACPM